jgi:hypothetical protein
VAHLFCALLIKFITYEKNIFLLEKTNSSVWNLVLLCLMWIIWRERNGRIFEDKDHSKTKLIELFFGTLFDWARVWGLTSAVSLADFVASLSFA